MKTHRLRFLGLTPLLLVLFVGSVSAMLCASWSFGADGGVASNNLIVYGPVPGLPPSEHYAVRVRPAAADAPWQTSFVFKTACKDFGRFDPKKLGQINTEGYCAHLSGWSHSYVNFETAGPVEVEIAKVDGTAIRKATVHPVRYGKNVHLKDGKAFLTLEKPCLVAVDIDGTMLDQDTTRTPDGGWYSGPPIHAISIFANPIFASKPQLGDPSVFAVKPGEKPPTNGNWKTLYFLPGVHDIGLAYPLHAGKNYYIPGDALVHGTLHQENNPDGGHDIRIFGCGTLSGERLPSAYAFKLKAYAQYSPIWIQSPYNATIEGITITDAASWSIQVCKGTHWDPARPTVIHWVKVIGWRYTSDAFGAASNALVEDCFTRTNDDVIYPCGFGIRRLVIWHDGNGSSFLLTNLPMLKGRPLVVEDCDVIFARQSQYRFSSGSRIFNMRGEGKGEGGRNVIFRNIRVEDPRPTQQAFLIQMATEKPYVWPEPMSRGQGDLVGVLFQNIQIAAPSILGEPNILWGGPECKIRDLTFDNVTIGGKKLNSIKDFKTNEYVENIHFK